jgi:hypothetical protein
MGRKCCTWWTHTALTTRSASIQVDAIQHTHASARRPRSSSDDSAKLQTGRQMMILQAAASRKGGNTLAVAPEPEHVGAANELVLCAIPVVVAAAATRLNVAAAAAALELK